MQRHYKLNFVFVTDANDKLTYALLGRNSVDPGWFNSVRPSLDPLLDALRGRVRKS